MSSLFGTVLALLPWLASKTDFWGVIDILLIPGMAVAMCWRRGVDNYFILALVLFVNAAFYGGITNLCLCACRKHKRARRRNPSHNVT